MVTTRNAAVESIFWIVRTDLPRCVGIMACKVEKVDSPEGRTISRTSE